jgi:hypothetical protein
MAAWRYNGLNGHGRIVDFVVGNEVAASSWFNPGCGVDLPCDKNFWIELYAQHFAAVCDGVKSEQPEARLFVEFAHALDASIWDTKVDGGTNSEIYYISAMTFLKGATGVTGFVDRIGARKWQGLWHPDLYPDATWDVFDFETSGRVGWSNLGHLVGWLGQAFPSQPSTWRIFTMEGGLNSGAGLDLQNTLLCKAFQVFAGTPGFDKMFVYRMIDYAEDGAAYGLHAMDQSPKPSWSTFVSVNSAAPACGFEILPYTRLQRYYHSGLNQHWASTRPPPAGYDQETGMAWCLWRESQPGTVLLWECLVGRHSVVVNDPGVCTGGLVPMGPLGYAYDPTPPNGTASRPIYRCYIAPNASLPWGDHYLYDSATCPVGIYDGFLGYGLAP